MKNGLIDRKIWLFLSLCICPFFCFADGNSAVALSYKNTKCGLGYVQTSRKITSRNPSGGAGAGLPATFAIAGIPAGAVIEKAYVWCILSYLTGPSNPAVSVTNPASVLFNYTGYVMGTAPEKCWSEVETRSYKCDVTSAISGNGNYVVNIGLPVADIDGMTLFVIYSQPTATFQGDLIVWDGCISSGGGVTAVTMNGFTACAAATTANANGFVIDSDFQALTLVPQPHTVTVNGVATSGLASTFYECYVKPATITAGQTTSVFGAQPSVTDCYAILAIGLYFKTTTCGTCPVPLEISYFDATCSESSAKLEWIVTEERGLKEVALQRSRDGISFQDIYTEQNLASGHRKEYKDKALSGGSYYRMVERFFDKGDKYYESRYINCSPNDASREILINAMQENIKLVVISPAEEPINIEIFNLTGQLMYSKSLPTGFSGEYVLDNINLNSNQIYFYKISNNGKYYTGKWFNPEK